MYGAVIGDIVGSPFEFDRGEKTKEFLLFSERCRFTDDTVMTVAVAEALLLIDKNASDFELEESVIKAMQKWGQKYTDAGYGGRFAKWLSTDDPQPYHSYGNGSAMRVSSAGWLYDTMEKTRRIAVLTAKVTHDHEEGLKGAEATAAAIFLARNGKKKEEIKQYIEQEFGYNLNKTLDEIRPDHHMDISCQGTVPEALRAFLEAKDYEDTIRNAVSLGGDTDTLAAIAGSVAEAFYGIPEALKKECRNRIPKEMCDVIEMFSKRVEEI